MTSILNQPATWFAEPGADGVAFTMLDQAVVFAMSLPLDYRLAGACLVTESGSVFGWDAIETMAVDGYKFR